jgi:hypothetical protein
MRRIRQLDRAEMHNWRESVGGLKAAARLISEKLECSESKAEKLASGRYPSLPTPTEQMALAALMKRPRDVLFPFVVAKGRAKAS